MKFLLLSALLASLTQLTPAALAAQEFILVATPPGAESGSELMKQLGDWKASGVISHAQLFESEPGEEAHFQLFGIISFADSSALSAWVQSHSAGLPSDVTVTEVDVLASLGPSTPGSTNPVFEIMQYDVLVDRAQFEDYITGYQLPEMVAREKHGGLKRYTSYFAHPGSAASWQSLIIMEYRDESALAESKLVNKSLGEHLAQEDERFNHFKHTKNGIRTKTGVTRARALSLEQ